MGIGDKLMAIGDAWAQYLADPQKRFVAIGNGQTLDQTDADLTWGLEFLAVQDHLDMGAEVTWVKSWPGNRPYINYAAMEDELRARGIGFTKRSQVVKRLGRYIWNLDYRPTPAPVKLRAAERAIATHRASTGPYVVIEPFTKPDAPASKQWPVAKFYEVARRLAKDVQVFQISPPGRPTLDGLARIEPQTFREALGYLSGASLYLGPEGGLHHGAAAVGTPGVVIYGGFVSPLITGYPNLHINLTGGETEACGTRFGMCPHCAAQFEKITVDEVVGHARQMLEAPRGLARAASY